jgi:hypothetical protein
MQPYIFEIADRQEQIAVFVDRARLERAQNNPGTADKGIYSWNLASVLSAYVSGKDDLPKLIRSAHDAIDQNNPGAYPFEDIASELSAAIFGGLGDRDIAEAGKALSALKELARSTQDPVVVVRLISVEGRAIYLPFGLLAARSRDPVLSKRITVIQPLQGLASSTSACVDKWWIARPPELQGIRGDASDLLTNAANRGVPDGMTSLENHDKLVSTQTALRASGRMEGPICCASLQLSSIRRCRPPVRIPFGRANRRFPGKRGDSCFCSTGKISKPAPSSIDLEACGGGRHPFAVCSGRQLWNTHSVNSGRWLLKNAQSTAALLFSNFMLAVNRVISYSGTRLHGGHMLEFRLQAIDIQLC